MTQEQFQLIAFKISKLAEHFDCSPDDISDQHGEVFEHDGEEFLILSDDEADERVREYILESVWAFRPEFLAGHLKDGVDQEVIELIQSNGKCESNNSAILSLIDDLDHLIDDAIKCDGRGHFLAQYDGDEIELGNDLFAYRIN